MSSLQPLLQPRSVAIIGASAEPYAIGGRPIRYLRQHGYTGRIYPVNPKYPAIAGLTCYPSLREVPEPVDCAIIAVPAAYVFDYLVQLRETGARSAIIFTAGFAETGTEGRAKQADLRRFARETGIRLVGPNCVGLVNLKARVVATFSNIAERPVLKAGNVAILAQSGAIGGSLFDRCQDEGIGVSYVITTGNEADVETAELLEYLVEDPDIAVIACFVESLKEPERFLVAATRAREAGKPVLVLKAGASEKGQRVIASHTGALSSADAVHSAIFAQYEVLRMQDLEEMLYHLSVFSRCVLPQGRRLGVLSLSGGAAALVSDACERYGFTLPDLAPITLERLRQWIPAYGSAANPADTSAATFGDPNLFPNCLNALSADPNFDLMLSVITAAASPMAESFGRGIVAAGEAHAAHKPSASVWISGSLSEPGLALVRESRVPVFRSIETALRTLDRFAGYAERRRARAADPAAYAPAAPRIENWPAVEQQLGAVNPPLTEQESAAILAQIGIPTVRQALATSAEEAARLATAIGFPVALKIASPDIAHKTQAGGVRLHLTDVASVRQAYEAVMASCRRYAPQATLHGVLVAQMARPGLELIAGVSRDPQFGPMVMVGFGGIYVEILRDTALRRAPLSRADAHAMLESLRGYPLLRGVRGTPPADLDAVIEVLIRLGEFAVRAGPTIQEVDINPLLVYPQGEGVLAVDALIVKGPAA